MKELLFPTIMALVTILAGTSMFLQKQAHDSFCESKGYEKSSGSSDDYVVCSKTELYCEKDICVPANNPITHEYRIEEFKIWEIKNNG